MIKKILIVICTCVCAFCFFKGYQEYWLISMISEKRTQMNRFYVSSGYQSSDAYIAHGGGIGEFTYTNCLEAVLDSLKKGFHFIEIDMIETSDGHILGAHDWKKFKSLVAYKDNSSKSLSFNKVKDLKIKEKYSILTGNNICDLMKSYPDFILVTDKIKNYKLLLKEIPFPDRIICEVFSVNGYRKALRAGIKYPAYCIWDKDSFDTAVKYKFPIVTMDAKNFFDNEDTINIVQNLHDSGVTILLFYTSFSRKDTPEFVKKYVGKAVSKIYTDIWSPDNLP